MTTTTKLFGFGLLAVLGLTSLASAQLPSVASHSEPASILVFPCFDARPGMGTIITVTNTNKSRVRCRGTTTVTGSVGLLYTYIDGVTCREFNVAEFLTPGDTLTVFADVHSPEMNTGWLWVEAFDPQTGNPIDFDFLIGSAILVDTGTNFVVGYTPYSFKALTADEDNDGCDRDSTDLNGDNNANFDGIEYEFWPQIHFLDRFFQEGGAFQNEIAIMTARDAVRPNPSEVEVRTITFNNRELGTSRNFFFTCFTRGPLGTLVARVRNLGGDPNELVVGGRSIQTGWMRLESTDPILGIYIDRIDARRPRFPDRIFEAGRELWYQDALGDDRDEQAAFLPHGI
jgi:hypothetical protein